MDLFEKELENDMRKALAMMKKKYPEETRVANAGNVLVLRKFLDLYRSDKIKADRMAGALEEVAKEQRILFRFHIDEHARRQITEQLKEAARAIRSKNKGEQ